jgi:hypothetical protein
VSSPTGQFGTDSDDAEQGRSSSAVRRRFRDPRRPALAAAGAATVAVGLLTILRVLYHVPFDPVEFSSEVLAVGSAVAAGVLALALVTTAVASVVPAVRVGLLFAGAFGGLAAFVDAAVVPGVVGVVVGATLALAGALGLPATYRGVRGRIVAGGFVLAVATSLAASTGLLAVGGRTTGSVLFLGALTLLAVRTRGDRVALAAGALAAAAVVGASLGAPFVAGSALLVGFGVVGGPHLLAAAAAFGVAAAASAGVRQRRPFLLVGAVLLGAAGVPATPTAAMAVVLGAAFACVDPAELGIDTTTEHTGATPEPSGGER